MFDEAFMVLATMVVLLMGPGFALLEAGAAHSSSAVHLLMKNFVDCCISGVAFWSVGYAIAFGVGPGHSEASFAGASGFFLVDVNLAKFFAQYAYAANAATIFGGSVAGRTRFLAYVVVAMCIAAFVVPHHRPFMLLGVWLLAATWPAFNVLSVAFLPDNISDDVRGRVAGRCATNTMLALSAAGTVQYLLQRSAGATARYSLAEFCNAVLGGAVSVTAGCAVMQPWAAIVVGTVASVVVGWASRMQRLVGLDDPLDAAPVHAACGAWGTIALGLLADTSLMADIGRATPGEGGMVVAEGAGQLGAQLTGLLAVATWAVLASLLVFGALTWWGQLRVADEQQVLGMDLTKHDAEHAYPEFELRRVRGTELRRDGGMVTSGAEGDEDAQSVQRAWAQERAMRLGATGGGPGHVSDLPSPWAHAPAGTGAVTAGGGWATAWAHAWPLAHPMAAASPDAASSPQFSPFIGPMGGGALPDGGWHRAANAVTWGGMSVPVVPRENRLLRIFGQPAGAQEQDPVGQTDPAHRLATAGPDVAPETAAVPQGAVHVMRPIAETSREEEARRSRSSSADSLGSPAMRSLRSLRTSTPTGQPDVGEGTAEPVPSGAEFRRRSDAGDEGQAAASTEGEHVLTTPWVLWEERDSADKGPDEKWGDLLIPVGEFSTVEQFWRLWTHVPKLTQLLSSHAGPCKVTRKGADGGKERTGGVKGLMIFRKGIRPAMEHKGEDGKPLTTHRLRSDQNSIRTPQEADHWEKAWETLILSLIGESLPSASAINGAYLSDKTRRGRVMFRLELWSTKMLDSSVSRMCQEALSAAKPKQFSVKV
ncbi:hypothetical protein FNF28_01732 [Cafeteria roenbergensis]|uniref:Ammonium transporter AmtB-like domain-containing protein n=1 Tax=Cafeteria roenbergensis TaxID=33653 RepID=A0A5A8DWR7_CAFRO|nr:hypothetical protein FNF28_01732 [Cafeteria roenbergensis]